MLPKAMLDYIPDDFKDETGLLKILMEEEWRSLGITQVHSDMDVDDGTFRERLLISSGPISRWAGNTTRFMHRSRTYFCSSTYIG